MREKRQLLSKFWAQFLSIIHSSYWFKILFYWSLCYWCTKYQIYFYENFFENQCLILMKYSGFHENESKELKLHWNNRRRVLNKTLIISKSLYELIALLQLMVFRQKSVSGSTFDLYLWTALYFGCFIFDPMFK